ncbi:hypothetical protein JCM21714_4025 [Gracilibacillus boraciitolerans JCM 21714]|uniref:TIGR02679 family protein n=1 Tax=Gracilibacillus boraciitolerans JCM 21714 TaxID=1298598 RepID=W4VNT2_9BACI|nr:TIGR02679 family protein [Gracilibacillus boraciitolerans]GAE94831.1 hypothetical protein JCM21714_4025 [Gracilibacillus boraciitolerans JCM 21714]
MIEDAIHYFAGDKTYRRLFLLFKAKYKSLGRVGGTITVDAFTDKELEVIGRFFGKTGSELRQKGKISLEQFNRQLNKTRFAGIDLQQLLEAYFDETLISNKELQQRKEQKVQDSIKELKDHFPELRFWLEYIQHKTADTYWIFRLIEKDFDQFQRMLRQLASAFSQIPEKYERLPMFSQRITRNPHAFDLNTVLGKLLIHLLSLNSNKGEQVVVPSTSEAINDLLLQYQLLRDDITNYVTCANLLAETKQEVHSMWKAAAETQSVLNVPLRELIKVERVFSSGKQNIIWIVENSGVFSSLLDEVPHISLICTHGQFKLAAFILMDLLVQEGYQLRYAGDIDPEGISMAAKIVERYPQHAYPWKMTVDDYHLSMSDNQLSEERINKLDAVNVNSLQPVINELKTYKKAGYQEALVVEMVEELRLE